LFTGSFQFGIVSDKVTDLTNLTSNHGAYINDDMKTGYFGKLFESKMIEGQPVHVIGMEKVNDVVIPIFSEPHGSMFKFAHAADGTFNDGQVTDAVEDKYVYVNKSLTINGGQGLFAKVDIPGGTNFAYFGGHVYTDKQWNATTFFDPNYFAKFKDGKQQYFVHLPDEFGNDLNVYRATLGHKINHNFWFYNAGYVANFHPRFGLLAAVKSLRNIKAGQEILCHYDLQFHEAHPWYQEMWRTEVEYDTPEGPYGHREHRKIPGQTIQPMLVDSDLWKDFLKHVDSVLRLDPHT